MIILFLSLLTLNALILYLVIICDRKLNPVAKNNDDDGKDV
jgi:hypothetical protein